MKSDSLEDRMRRLECYHSMAALPGAWMVIRVDGRSFTRLTKVFEHPFDPKFHDYMVATALALLVELGGIYAFTESDEISVLLPRDTDLFGREVEKLVSVSAGVASSVFSIRLNHPAHFDSRVWVGVSNDDVVDYFRWRQSDASRCCLNGWCYWTLRGKGKSALEATKALEGKTFSEKNELLHKHGINFNNVPAWQKRGCGIYWENFEKNGFNPKKNETSMAGRSVVVDNTNVTLEERSELIQIGREYSAWVVGYHFRCSTQQSLDRNSRRVGKALIPRVGILAKAKLFVAPTLAEGFDELYEVVWGPEKTFLKASVLV